jgi:hypothetical protein
MCFFYAIKWIAASSTKFEEAMDYDDEIGTDGDIDIGEIASQYLSLELF